MKLTLAEFKEAYPEMYESIVRDGFDKGSADGYARGKAEGLEAGASSERDRIKAVEEQLIPGHEQLIATLAFDGVTTGPEAAVKVLAAEKTLRASKLASFVTEHSAVAAPAAPKDDKDRQPKEKASGAPESDLPPEEQAEKTWAEDPKIRAEFANNKEAYLAYVKADAAGRVKIYKGKGGN